MSIDRFVRRNRFACLLVALHTLLVGAYAWIELDDAWNDMNSTMLVMMGLYVIDYPLHMVLRRWIESVENTGTYLAVLLILGGAFWFIVGWIVAYFYRCSRAWCIGSWPAEELGMIEESGIERVASDAAKRACL